MSHVNKLRHEKGEEAVHELERRFGSSVKFKNMQDVPVRDEVRIIELALDILGGAPVDVAELAYEAGRLHLRNFMGTAFGVIISSALPKSRDGFRMLLLRSGYIARHVFKNSNFNARSDGNDVIVAMDNSDYPIEHFRGFFTEWMSYWGLEAPNVSARETTPHTFEYVMHIV